METDITPFVYGDQQVSVITSPDFGDVRTVVTLFSTPNGDKEKTTPHITTAGQEDLIDGWLTGRYTEDR